ncbi:hypothetical protein AUEXF2481DRAFT_28538 [Aureobasidium subglaciale EXF-2481]|uniref:Rhodopsin domain-containing protein n=1 Tax=Aureobasidium subglaciale (strain EXF-2481) TaxID=1043005 RepID=A0A074YFP0_AURSE|nr:uncharacterized protein AUEXF2481DRAFT_28538 [Aureobasidium subglaciale EXF-2481]KAI5201031.1 hypothetical protein E4T38_06281 [Aureobasidium subglaciale]KAI5219662.1 hypothetical protein E4T40_06261 [Aureobasidium subglaciale]KAI5223438.1 hypothetical protein E4T41_06101 [Aureobasidium subglaciale]KAI5260445.1 hypothetical protein E4T46_06036 [Aureobasidium subglaciale]KEQ96608.1 hypothetical protein AUEXF2481DRAFT_28538 [Aureobasidium subglaciale EXF-2481]
MGNHTALPKDVLPPDVYYFAELTPTNHAGVVWVVCILSLTYGLLCSGVRFTLRRGMYGFDDAAILVSTLASVVQHSFVFLALENGLGDSSSTIQHKHQETLTESTYTRLVLFFVVHYLAKTSLTLFTRRLFYGQEKFNQLICDALVVVNLVFGVISILLLTINCQSGWYFKSKDVCPKLLTRWIVIKSLDVLAELALVLVPIVLICRILLNPKHKTVIIGTFAARLPVIAFTILHLYYLNKSLRDTHDRGIALVKPVVWLQATILWSMVTASLPSFRPLVSPFETVMEDSTTHSTSVYNGAALMMGSDKDKTGESPTSWGSLSGGRISQLEAVASNGSQIAKFKGTNETTIEGPKRKLFRLSKKEDDIELGTIQHITDFEVTYEQVVKPSRWSKVWRESGSTMVEDRPFSVGAVSRPDETPPPRRRSTYAFIDEAESIREAREASNDDQSA